MADSHRVVVVGMGKRGMHHAAAFQANPRFEVAGHLRHRRRAARRRRGEACRAPRDRATDAAALAAGGQARRLLLLHAARTSA